MLSARCILPQVLSSKSYTPHEEHSIEATIEINTPRFRLFNAANFGASFRVPGFVTIGPNMRVTGKITGDATLHA